MIMAILEADIPNMSTSELQKGKWLVEKLLQYDLEHGLYHFAAGDRHLLAAICRELRSRPNAEENPAKE